MKNYCTITDSVARKAVNITLLLEGEGLGKLFGRHVAIEYLARQCDIPILIAQAVLACLQEYHSVCSHGNKLCDIPSRCNKYLAADNSHHNLPDV